MSPVVEQKFDEAILQVLEANQTRFGLTPGALSNLVLEHGFSPTPEQVQRRLDYMADRDVGFVAPMEKGQFHPANQEWKITTKGINHLRMRGL